MRPSLLRRSPPLPILIFDGACGFCRRWVSRWMQRTGGAIPAEPYQALPLRRWGLSPARVSQGLTFVERPGAPTFGAEAVYRLLLHAEDAPVRWKARLGLLPGVLQVSQLVYRMVAKRRGRSARLDRLLFGRRPTVPRHRGVAALYLQGLGGIFAIAFHSLSRQLPGLLGERGIAPARETLAWQASRLPTTRERLSRMPSVFWFTGADESTLMASARLGRLAGVSLLLGILPLPALACATALYLSFLPLGRDFLSFQWDALLVESGLHGLLIAPLGLTLRNTREPAGLARLAHRLLYFRLNVGSGLGKWQSGDRRWRDGSALATHYETTPLPTPLSWHAHQLPMRVHRLSTRATLAVELTTPFLVFGPRTVRTLGFLLGNALQGVIAATGNYGFFNLHSSLLSLWALDDDQLGILSGSLRRSSPRSSSRELLADAVALPLVLTSIQELLARLESRPRPLRALARKTRPFMLGTPYALFSVMTGTRPEVVVEGSRDGVRWERYGFRYKVQDPGRRPAWVAPHMPRLDWQMWFAALQSPRGWFLDFARRLLEGAPEVLSLLERNPFPGTPPRYVRATLYLYRMTRRDARAASGDWWTRERLGSYLPPVELGPGGLRRAHEASVLEEIERPMRPGS